jgi:hypothetical protein
VEAVFRDQKDRGWSPWTAGNVITDRRKRRAKKGSLIGLGIQSNLTFSVISPFQIRVVPTAYGVDLSDVFAVP